MKLVNLALIPLTMACLTVANAETVSPAKQVNLPFSQERLFSKHHTGLFFNYDMSGSSAKKIVCELSNVYKGWLAYRNQGNNVESGVYGNGDSAVLVLTREGPTVNNQYHADSTGTVKVNAVKSEKGKNATASCHYE